MDFPCFLKQSVPLLGRFLGPGSRDCPVCHHCCCSAEGMPCQRAAPRLSLEQEAGARTEGHSSCRTRCPDVGTPVKTKAQLQQLLLAVKAIKHQAWLWCSNAMDIPGISKGHQILVKKISSIFTLSCFSRPRLWKELVNTQLRTAGPDSRILLLLKCCSTHGTEGRQAASQEWGRWLEWENREWESTRG